MFRPDDAIESAKTATINQKPLCSTSLGSGIQFYNSGSRMNAGASFEVAGGAVAPRKKKKEKKEKKE